MLHSGEVAPSEASSAVSVPPCNTLQRNRPGPTPAKSAAASASAMILRWSVRRWPVVFAAVRQHHIEAGEQSDRIRSTRVEKIDLDEFDAGNRRHGENIDRHHRPLPRPRRPVAATIQPPGCPIHHRAPFASR